MKKPLAIPDRQMDAWVLFVHAHARLMARLGADLDAAHEVPLGTYDVLVQLSQCGGKLRLKDLLDRVILSQPGLSRRVERLEAAGLVERRPDPNDGRGVVVVLTRAGRYALRSAAVVHMAGIDREFTHDLTDEEAEVLIRVFSRMLPADVDRAQLTA
ncbi:MarR family winged helix-turn-helix transcriptional regulator [Nakamurella deserti]|uniref:MarR family winged helix-turn-helix transcriptional regulator n=1 Tax=Nakamurella deserti TaxID=2164074 RepID=UPI000DBE79A6|nr:MarR family transcriptional regulator [Nakamurella deserti]